MADPSYIEGCVSEANIVFGINAYKELCGVHLGGITLTSPQLLLRCVNKGAERAKMIVTMIKEAVAKDSAVRAEGVVPNFAEIIRNTTITSLREKPLQIKLKKFKAKLEAGSTDVEMKDEEFEDSKVTIIEKNTGVLLPESKTAQWIVDSSSSDEESVTDDVKATTTKEVVEDDSDDDSEEDVKMIVESNI